MWVRRFAQTLLAVVLVSSGYFLGQWTSTVPDVSREVTFRPLAKVFPASQIQQGWPDQPELQAWLRANRNSCRNATWMRVGENACPDLLVVCGVDVDR